MDTITAVIPTKNEEKNIEKCIKSVLWCDKIIVFVSGNDRTGDIAKKLGAEVIDTASRDEASFEDVQRNLNYAIKTCKTDWMLRIDADEVVTEELQDEIISILKSKAQISNDKTKIVAYGIPRKQFFLKRFLKGGDWAYDRLVRLFKPQFCLYEPVVKVHEQFKVKGDIGYLNSPLLHYSHPDIKTLMNKFDIYTTLESRQLKETMVSAFLKLLFVPPYVFLRWMIYHRGYLDGWLGIQAGLNRAYYDVLLYSKFLLNNQLKK